MVGHGIYTGSCGALTEVACGPTPFRSTVRAGVTYWSKVEAGAAYHIYNEYKLSIVAALLAPPSDACAAATVVPSAPVFLYKDVVYNVKTATCNTSDPFLSCSNDAGTV